MNFPTSKSASDALRDILGRRSNSVASGPTRTSRDVRFRAAIGGIADVDVLRLTLLAPDIIEMILDGRQPRGLQFERLRLRRTGGNSVRSWRGGPPDPPLSRYISARISASRARPSSSKNSIQYTLFSCSHPPKHSTSSSNCVPDFTRPCISQVSPVRPNVGWIKAVRRCAAALRGTLNGGAWVAFGLDGEDTGPAKIRDRISNLAQPMATRGRVVHALDRKIRVIAEILCELGVIESGSRRELAKEVGIEYHTLKTAWRFGRASSELEAALARTAGFTITDHAWVDEAIDSSTRTNADGPNYTGRDSVAAFRALLRRSHGLSGAGTALRLLSRRPKLTDANLATFSIDDSGQGSVLGEPTPLFFTIVVQRGFHSKDVVFGFRRVRLRLEFQQESEAQAQERLGFQRTVEINGATLEVRGSPFHPEWFLHIEGNILDGEYMSIDDPFCVLSGLAIDEEFHADISVRPLDGTLVASDGTPLPDSNKRRIIERLAAKKLAGAADSNGWMSLGRQSLRILRADQA